MFLNVFSYYPASRRAENSIQVAAQKRQLRGTETQPTRSKHEFDVLAAIAFLRDRKIEPSTTTTQESTTIVH